MAKSLSVGVAQRMLPTVSVPTISEVYATPPEVTLTTIVVKTSANPGGLYALNVEGSIDGVDWYPVKSILTENFKNDKAFVEVETALPLLRLNLVNPAGVSTTVNAITKKRS